MNKTRSSTKKQRSLKKKKKLKQKQTHRADLWLPGVKGQGRDRLGV